jgi:hypothetical protein
MVKARIAEGYPKLAQYIGLTWNINDPYRRTVCFPSRPKSYRDITHKMQHGEIIVLANASWRDGEYHFVPLKLLEEKQMPINSILTWVRAYIYLPRINESDIVVL